MNFGEREIEAAEATVARQADAVIRRIRDGLAEAGQSDCEDCGEPIGDARRAALPSADRCVACQDKFERKGKRRARGY